MSFKAAFTFLNVIFLSSYSFSFLEIEAEQRPILSLAASHEIASIQLEHPVMTSDHPPF